MITLITSKDWKRNEFAAILGLPDLARVDFDITEIQSLDVEKIVTHKMRAAYEHLGSPVIVDDTSFSVSAWRGLPGPFARYFEEKKLYDDMLLSAKEKNDFRALVTCCIGYKDGEREFFVKAEVPGELVYRTAGDGVGFDFYFKPDGFTESYAQMGPKRKSEVSHRFQALQKMRERLKEAEVSFT